MFCVYLKVTTSNGSVYSACQSKYFLEILSFRPPETLQLFPVSRRQLNVLWERPEGLEPSEVQIHYKVILRDHLGQCQDTIKTIFDEMTSKNTYIYTSLMPWSRYSVIVCSGLIRKSIPENKTACTCGDYRHKPRGPVFNQTLPEEPTERPDVQPCEAWCSETNFTATLKWKAGEKLIWNGIPKESVIRIYTLNSSSHSIAGTDQNKLGSLVRTFHVPLETDYNGSLVRFSVSLNNQWNYLYKVQFCSNGGCGPSAEGVLSCDACTLLGVPSAGAITEKTPTGEDSYWLAIIAGVTLFFLGAVVILWILKRKRRYTNLPPLQERLGSLPPGNVYEYLDSADMKLDSGPYSQLYSSETRLLHIDQQDVQQV